MGKPVAFVPRRRTATTGNRQVPAKTACTRDSTSAQRGPIEQPTILGWCDTVTDRTVEAMNQIITANAEESFAAPRPARRRLPLNARHALLTAHIVMAVALLGDAAGDLAVAIRTSTIDNPVLVHDSAKTLNLFSLVFGIPLSFGALVTGLALGLGTRWGVFRYPWVVAKLALIVSVILVGAFVIGPGSNDLVQGTDTTGRLIAGAAYDVAALTIATSLSVFKPGRAFRREPRTPSS